MLIEETNVALQKKDQLLDNILMILTCSLYNKDSTMDHIEDGINHT